MAGDAKGCSGDSALAVFCAHHPQRERVTGLLSVILLNSKETLWKCCPLVSSSVMKVSGCGTSLHSSSDQRNTAIVFGHSSLHTTTDIDVAVGNRRGRLGMSPASARGQTHYRNNFSSDPCLLLSPASCCSVPCMLSSSTVLGASVAAETAHWVPLSRGGDDLGHKGGGKSFQHLGAFLTAVILRKGRKGVMQKTARLGSKEQPREGKQSLIASKIEKQITETSQGRGFRKKSLPTHWVCLQPLL